MNAIQKYTRPFVKSAKSSRSFSRNAAGTSYLEVIILVMTVGILMSGLTGAISQGLEDPSHMVRIQQASEMVQASLESFTSARRRSGFAAIPAGGVSNLSDSFVRTITVADDVTAACPSAVVGQCKRVTVTITRNNQTLGQGALLLVNYDS
ncbi:MAG: hypothetical protein HQL64_04155 [Magnetococcales bacterium]|nr:hypothetical protein [Magnetococcales bacterium]